MFRKPIGLPFRAHRRLISTQRIFSNVKLVTSQFLDRPGGGTLIKRVGLIFGVYVVIDILFNAMLFSLSVDYITKIQPIPASFKLKNRYKFLQGVISDDVLMKPGEAHQEYKEILERLGSLNAEELSHRDKAFVGAYADLLLRFALTSTDKKELETYLQKAFGIIKADDTIGTATLKNQALRALATLEPDKAENHLQRAVEVIAQVDDLKFKDFGIVPPNTTISQTMLQTLLELTYHYTDTLSNMDKSFAILVSILRSFEFTKATKLKELQRNQSTSLQKEITRLDTELIPLVKSNISEILWFTGDREQALKWAQESALESLANTREDFNSARVCKNSFKNLSKMYTQLKDKENAEFCAAKSNDINLLIPVNFNGAISLRSVILQHYFGYWGKILFP